MPESKHAWCTWDIKAWPGKRRTHGGQERPQRPLHPAHEPLLRTAPQGTHRTRRRPCCRWWMPRAGGRCGPAGPEAPPLLLKVVLPPPLQLPRRGGPLQSRLWRAAGEQEEVSGCSSTGRGSAETNSAAYSWLPRGACIGCSFRQSDAARPLPACPSAAARPDLPSTVPPGLVAAAGPGRAGLPRRCGSQPPEDAEQERQGTPVAGKVAVPLPISCQAGTRMLTQLA